METDPIQRCGSKANVEEVAVWTNFSKKIWKKEENKLIGKMADFADIGGDEIGFKRKERKLN